MRQDTSRKFDWSPSMETLEDRVMMSADPVGGFLGGAIGHHAIEEGPPTIEHHALAEEPPALDHHLGSTPDFWIDQDTQVALEEELRRVDQTLANANNQTGLSTIRANYGFTGAGQTVAVIDSGIAYDHFALGGGFGSNYRVVGGWDFTGENDADPYDDGPSGSHGTHVAGIVGGDAGSHTGVAPDVDLVALRVFDDAGAGYFNWVENALTWVHNNRNSFENPITAVNLSLGVASWNSDTIPAWANLEEEFAQLEADGIFIAVSAGNSFSSFGTAGLSYPAASQYVIPVMSVDDGGLLSYFSQRHSRAIAAPGRSITSTVPDYAGPSGNSNTNNGITDDYKSLSGTSMASPYVAGASVIIREAMEFVGQTNITQDTIYNHMIATADTIFDSNTGQSYSSLNMEAAIEALMPSDDFGSTVGTAYDLGTVSTPVTMSGMIGSLTDVDYFSFTAASTGTVTFTASNTTHNLCSSWDVTGGTGWTSGDHDEIYTVDVAAGQSYTVGISSSVGLGAYDLDITSESTFTFTDWGSVASNLVNNVSVDGEAWYRVEASSEGYLTADATFDGSGGQLNLELYDANLQQIDSGSAVSGTSRVDTYASEGDEFYVRVVGTNNDADFRLTNLVLVDGTDVQVAGTSGDDVFAFTAGTNHVVSVNGVEYSFASIAITGVSFNGGGGVDSITMTGTSADETANLSQGSASLAGSGFAATASGIENIDIHGGGGNDWANLYDSVDDNTYTVTGTQATMTGTGFQNRAFDFARTNGFATAGGYDIVEFFDTAGNDTFTARPEENDAFMSSAGLFSYASGFDRVNAYATAGGYDTVQFYDTAGDDTVTARPEENDAFMAAPEIFTYTMGFERVNAYATAGGYDKLEFFDTVDDDTMTFRPEENDAFMFAGGVFSYGQGFERYNAFATSGGYDKVEFFDTSGDDTFTVRPEEGDAFLIAGGVFNYAEGFERVNAYATAGGHDTVEFYDTAGDDTFTLRPEENDAFLYAAGIFNYAVGFERVNAYATAGGYDKVEIYDTAGDDVVTMRPNEVDAFISSPGVFGYAKGFERVNAYATNGGYDKVEFYDTAGNDFYTFRPSENDAFMASPGVFGYASGFERADAYATAGGSDHAIFTGTAGNDNFAARADQNDAYMYGSGYFGYTQGFELVDAYGGSGGTDSAALFDSLDDDLLVANGAFASLSGSGRQYNLEAFDSVTAHSLAGGDDSVSLGTVDYVFDQIGAWS